MTLVKDSLKEDIKTLLTDLSSRTEDPEKAVDDLAEQLSTIIDSYIKTATITVAPGISVVTVGSATTQTGTTTSSGTGVLS